MSYLSILFGAILAGVAVYYWYKWHKDIKGDSADGSSRPARKEAESLEAIVAAYHRGELPGNSPSAARPAPAAPAATFVAAAAPAPLLAEPARREGFLSGATKLGYLLCKSALRDHHVFAHVPLHTLSASGLDPKLAQATVDLLVCNAGLEPVAAIDVSGAEAPPPDAAKAQALRGLGIRYLRLSAKSLPRPGQLKDLLYRM